MVVRVAAPIEGSTDAVEGAFTGLVLSVTNKRAICRLIRMGVCFERDSHYRVDSHGSEVRDRGRPP
jgi:hypothetical protein